MEASNCNASDAREMESIPCPWTGVPPDPAGPVTTLIDLSSTLRVEQNPRHLPSRAANERFREQMHANSAYLAKPAPESRLFLPASTENNAPKSVQSGQCQNSDLPAPRVH